MLPKGGGTSRSSLLRHWRMRCVKFYLTVQVALTHFSCYIRWLATASKDYVNPVSNEAYCVVGVNDCERRNGNRKGGSKRDFYTS